MVNIYPEKLNSPLCVELKYLDGSFGAEVELSLQKDLQMQFKDFIQPEFVLNFSAKYKPFTVPCVSFMIWILFRLMHLCGSYLLSCGVSANKQLHDSYILFSGFRGKSTGC